MQKVALTVIIILVTAFLFFQHASFTGQQTDNLMLQLPEDYLPQPAGFRACNRIDRIAQIPQATVAEVVAQAAGPSPSWLQGEPYVAAEITTLTGNAYSAVYKAFGMLSGEQHVQSTYPYLNLRPLFPSVSAHGNKIAYILEQYPYAGYATRYLFIKETGPGFFGEGNEVMRVAFAPIGPWTLSAAGAGRNFDLVDNGVIYGVYNTETYNSYYVRQAPGQNNIYEALPSDDLVEFVNLPWPSNQYATENPETSATKISAYIDNGNRLRIIGPGPDGMLDGGLNDDESHLIGGAGNEFVVDVALADDASFVGALGGSVQQPVFWHVASLFSGSQGRLPTPPVFSRVMPQQPVANPVAIAMDIDGQWNSAPVAGSMATVYTDALRTAFYLDYRRTPNGVFLDGDDVAYSLTFPLTSVERVFPKSVSIKENRVSFAVNDNSVTRVYQATFC